MKLFLGSASFKRDYGGPAYSVSRLALALAESGATVALWAPDGSAPEAQQLWTSHSHMENLLPYAGRLQASLEAFGGADIIHDSGLWLPHNHRLARAARRRGTVRVVSTRGMLDPWALGHKRIKKALAWYLYQRSDLRSAHALHATSEAEIQNVQALGLDVPVWHLPNGVDLPPDENTAFLSAHSGKRRAVFLGRLHPVKGLPALLHAWAGIQPRDWELVIAGPDEAGYGKQIASEIARHDLEGVVKLIGEVAGENKTKLLSGSDLLVLPSQSESFGMVVAEALAHGIPVLASTNVPWPQLVSERCGWQVAAEASALIDALRQITALPRDELAEAGRRGRALVTREYGWEAIAQSLLTRYEELLSGQVVTDGS